MVATLPAAGPAEARALVAETLALMQANLAHAVAARDRTRATLAHLADGRARAARLRRHRAERRAVVDARS